MSAETRELRWLAPLFLALVILYLVPIWSVPFIPTADGPSHLYNSWVIKELIKGDAGILERVYRVDWRPHPNWLGHAVMTALMFVVKPVIAEKLLFTLIIVLFLGGAWMLCDAIDRRSRAYAFLAFPLAYHQLLQTGFYNFALSIGLYLVTLAVWWKRRDRPALRTIALVALLLVLCYFAHPMSAALAIGSVGLLWLLTLRGRPFVTHVRHLAALIPVVPFMLWFVLQRSSETVVTPWSPLKLFVYLFQTEFLVTFDTRWLIYGRWLFGLYVVLIIATFARDFRWREENAFGILFLVILTIYIFSPDSFAGGQLVRERLGLYIFLVPLAWFSPRMPKSVLAAIAVILSIVAVIKAVQMTERFRHYSAEVVTYVRGYHAVKPNSTLLPLLFTRDSPGAFTGVIGHASGYVAIEKRLVDLDNYEPRTGYFPIAFRPDYKPPGVYWIEAKPAELDVPAYAPYARFAFTWKMPDDAPVVEKLLLQYRLIDTRGDAKVYERKEESQFRTGEKLQDILLPIGGSPKWSAADSAAPKWRVAQLMRNTGPSNIRVALSACPDLGQCEIDVKPDQPIPLAVSPSDAQYLIVTARDAEAAGLSFETNVQRLDGESVRTSVAIPAVREGDFRARRIVIPGVRFNSSSRLNLRLWTRGVSGASNVGLRILGSNGKPLSEVAVLTDASGFFIHGDLARLFEGVPNVPVSIEADVLDDDAKVWAFVTSTDNATDRVTVHLP